jgi:hypothetical protein
MLDTTCSIVCHSRVGGLLSPLGEIQTKSTGSLPAGRQALLQGDDKNIFLKLFTFSQKREIVSDICQHGF